MIKGCANKITALTNKSSVSLGSPEELAGACFRIACWEMGKFAHLSVSSFLFGWGSPLEADRLLIPSHPGKPTLGWAEQVPVTPQNNSGKEAERYRHYVRCCQDGQEPSSAGKLGGKMEILDGTSTASDTARIEKPFLYSFRAVLNQVCSWRCGKTSMLIYYG